MPPFWKTRGRIAAVIAATALFVTASAAVPTNTFNEEYQLKAVFLYNFLQFVDWPTNSFADAHSPFYICVLGDDPFGPELDQVMADERLEGRPIVIERHKEVADTTHCHLVFVAQDSQARRQHSIATLQKKSVLTVSDTENFANEGGVIELDVQNNHIKLLVNLQAANEAQLRVSSKLLRKAQIVGTRG
jgi:hypothetical protein